MTAATFPSPSRLVAPIVSVCLIIAPGAALAQTETATPTPTPTATASATASPTNVSGPSPTRTPGNTRTPTAGFTGTETRTPTTTPPFTHSATRTRTSSPTRTPSPPRTSTRTVRPSPSTTGTRTTVPTRTGTPMNTPTASATGSPTALPATISIDLIADRRGDNNDGTFTTVVSALVADIRGNPVNDGVVVVFSISQPLPGITITQSGQTNRQPNCDVSSYIADTGRPVNPQPGVALACLQYVRIREGQLVRIAARALGIGGVLLGEREIRLPTSPPP